MVWEASAKTTPRTPVQEIKQLVEEALGTLNEPQRQTMQRVIFEGLILREVAEHTSESYQRCAQPLLSRTRSPRDPVDVRCPKAVKDDRLVFIRQPDIFQYFGWLKITEIDDPFQAAIRHLNSVDWLTFLHESMSVNDGRTILDRSTSG
jgi:hypothetical protein